MPPASATSIKQDGPTLSRVSLVDHALDVADREGLAAVSIRSIAQDLGVTPMALYWHVKNKDELLAAMGDRILGAMTPPAPDDSLGLAELCGLLTALVDALRRHPGSAALAQARVLQCESGQQVAERTLQVLRAAGFSVRQSADLARAALQTAITLVSGRPGAETSVPEDERAAVLAHKRAAMLALPVDRFPQLVECADALIDCPDENAYYAGGIELYLAGVTALARDL